MRDGVPHDEANEGFSGVWQEGLLIFRARSAKEEGLRAKAIRRKAIGA